jgi:hypothetical protein
MRTQRSLALTGHVRFVADAPGDPPVPVQASRLNDIRDRTDVPGTEYFLKRKFMSTANAKNFLLGANVDPAVYFDELEDRVRFTELFPVSLVSCALLERGTRHGHDFMQAPMVYSYHDIVVDRDVAMRLRSNDTLNVCFGYTGAGDRLFSAEIGLVPLAALASRDLASPR